LKYESPRLPKKKTFIETPGKEQTKQHTHRIIIQSRQMEAVDAYKGKLIDPFDPINLPFFDYRNDIDDDDDVDRPYNSDKKDGKIEVKLIQQSIDQISLNTHSSSSTKSNEEPAMSFLFTSMQKYYSNSSSTTRQQPAQSIDQISLNKHSSDSFDHVRTAMSNVVPPSRHTEENIVIVDSTSDEGSIDYSR
jgi:hypothetical protein